MNEYFRIISELESDLERLTSSAESMLGTAKSGIVICTEALVKLRWLVLQQGFPDTDSEIRFFKYQKPVAYSYLLFYQTVFELESFRSRYDNGMITRCMELKLDEINQFMEEHASYVQYYNCGFTYLDSLYFVRGRDEIPFELRGNHQLMDEQFNTWHDHTFSVIMANQMLVDYIREEIRKLENPGLEQAVVFSPSHQWYGKKIDLAELVYALHYAKLVDAGNISIRELADMVGGLFGIELGKDIYRLHTEILQRKTERTKFLDFLGSLLKQRLDESDY